MTDDEINQRLIDLLPPDSIKWLRTLVACNGYIDPAVVVGLMERLRIDIGWDELCVSGWCLGFGNDIPADTLPKAVALAAIKYLEQSND